MIEDLVKLIKEAEEITEQQARELVKTFFLKNITISESNNGGKWYQEVDTKEQLGIPSSHFQYHILTNNQILSEEVNKTTAFLANGHSILGDKFPDKSTIEFINYGDTELVYVGNIKDTQVTLLVGQPSTKYGTVKQEYDNLIHLASLCPELVVAPFLYHSNGKRECYLTSYLKQARCIASYDGKYGAYVPEPYYRFVEYNEEDEYLITKTIIASLINLYDSDKKLALADCKIGGGDFVMEKSYDEIPHTEQSTLEHLKLIAARKLINIEIKEYINLLRKEFGLRTYYRTLEQKDPSILVNLKNRVEMSKEAIEDGITLGLSLRKNNSK